MQGEQVEQGDQGVGAWGGHRATATGEATRPAERSIALVDLEAEVPAVLYQGLSAYLVDRPEWDQSSLLTSALASFLFQNGSADPSVAHLHLDGIERSQFAGP